jgi:hypothetical protein
MAIKTEGFSSTLKYFDLPKQSYINIGFGNDEYANISCERMVGHSFFCIKIKSKAMKMMKEKLFKVTFLGISKEAPYTADFRFDFMYPDLVKILEIIEEED